VHAHTHIHTTRRLQAQTDSVLYLPTTGVKIVEKVTVDKVLVSNNRVCGVRTNQGDVKCEVFVNCAGQVYAIGSINVPITLYVSFVSGQEI